MFTNDYAEVDSGGVPQPHTFTLGAHGVIAGLEVRPPRQLSLATSYDDT